MNGPGQHGDGRNPAADSASDPAGQEQFIGKKEQGNGGRGMQENIGDVIARRGEGEGRVVQRVGEALHRTVKI